MHLDLFDALDRDWATFARSRAGADALARWRGAEPTLGAYGALDELTGTLLDRCPSSDQRALMIAILRISATDADARRVVLRVLMPGLIRLARTHRFQLGGDAASVVVLAALDRIARYDTRRPGRPAANLVQDVRYALFRVVDRDRSTRPPSEADPEVLDLVPAEETSAPGEELLGLLRDAVADRSLGAEDARLIAATRIANVSTAVLAAAEGVRPCSIRKRRVRAERSLREAVGTRP